MMLQQHGTNLLIVNQTHTARVDRTEKTQKINGRLVHEQSSKSGGGAYGVVIADRFMVDAKSTSVDLNTLKSAVGSLEHGQARSDEE